MTIIIYYYYSQFGVYILSMAAIIGDLEGKINTTIVEVPACQ